MTEFHMLTVPWLSNQPVVLCVWIKLNPKPKFKPKDRIIDANKFYRLILNVLNLS